MTFTSYEKENAIMQFADKGNEASNVIQRGESLVYMRIPKDLELEHSENVEITYVGE